MSKAKTAKKFITVKTTDGPAAINLDDVERVAYETTLVPGLLAEREYLRLHLPSGHIDLTDKEEQLGVLATLGIKDLVSPEQESAIW